MNFLGESSIGRFKDLDQELKRLLQILKTVMFLVKNRRKT